MNTILIAAFMYCEDCLGYVCGQLEDEYRPDGSVCLCVDTYPWDCITGRSD